MPHMRVSNHKMFGIETICESGVVLPINPLAAIVSLISGFPPTRLKGLGTNSFDPLLH